MIYRAPLLRVVVPYAMGILLHKSVCLALLPTALCFILIFIALVIYQAVFSPRESHRLRYLFGVASFVLLLVAGYSIAISHEPELDNAHYNHFHSRTTYTTIRLTESPSQKQRSIQTIGEVMAISDSTSTAQTTGLIMLTFRPDEKSSALQYGDIIVTKRPPESARAPLNPGEFDYRSYLSSKGIAGQMFLDTTDWKKIEGTHQRALIHLHGLRGKVLQIIKQGCPDQEAFAVMAALIVGETDFMDREMMKEYSGAGVIHVLAVSGMHVGLIYAAILFLLRWMIGKRFLGLQFFIILFSLWLFAGLSGFSASVLRATVMFTIMSLGQTIRRRSDAFNNLCGGAIVLLAYDTHYLFDIGFQLSFAAVAGIILISPALENLFFFTSKWKRAIWSMICVTTAAQLTTLPFIAYYFHVFPAYFLIANLIIVPYSTVIVYGGIVMLLLSFSPWILKVIGAVCEWMVLLLNKIVSFFSALPGSSLNIGYPDAFECTVLCFICLGLYLILDNHLQSGIRTLLISLSALFIYQGYHASETSNTNQLTFLAAGKGQFIISQTGDTADCLTDSLAGVNDRLKSAANTWLGESGVESVTRHDISEQIRSDKLVVDSGLIVVNGLTILCDTSYSHSRTTDYLLVPGNQVPSARYLPALLKKAEVIVFPSSVSAKKKTRLLEVCTEEEMARLKWLGEGAIHISQKY